MLNFHVGFELIISLGLVGTDITVKTILSWMASILDSSVRLLITYFRPKLC